MAGVKAHCEGVLGACAPEGIGITHLLKQVVLLASKLWRISHI